MFLIPLMIFSLVTIYNASCTLEYNRENVPIPMYEGEVENDQIYDVIDYFLDDFNDCANHLEFEDNGEVKSPYSLQKLNKIVEKEFKRLDDDYFSNFTSWGKPMMTSFLYREFWITGIYFAPFGESNINVLSTNSEIPHTLCHEIAHSKGVIREDDANIVATYLTLTSDDYYLRYSGYVCTFSRLLSLAQFSDVDDASKTLRNKISDDIYSNYAYNSDYWNKHDAWNEFMDWMNDLYLKSQGQSEGTNSYSDTPTVIDPDTNKVVSLSTYQKIYYQIYIDIFGSL